MVEQNSDGTAVSALGHDGVWVLVYVDERCHYVCMISMIGGTLLELVTVVLPT